MEKEEVLLDTAAEQFRIMLDGLLPQIRLAAIENEMESVADVAVIFTFEDDAITITTEGRVQFPAKVTETIPVTI